MNSASPIPLNASARIMYQEALARGISCELLGDKQTIIMKKNGKSWYTRGSRTSLQSSVGATFANEKNLTKLVLSHFDIPTARFVFVKKTEDLSQLETLTFPLVMKPSNGTHGEGVVVGIQNITEAEQAFQKINQPVLFEEMLEGTEYRILCINFQFVAAAFRKPAHVVGDGQHTIQELIDEKNKHPWRGEGHFNNLSLIKVDELVTKYIGEQGYKIESVPPVGVEVQLRKTANLSTGGEAWDVTDTVCAENRKLFEKISQVCDLNTIGIDIMCQTLEKPITEQARAGVIEVNDSPGLRMHHFPIQGKPVNAAGKILDMVEEKL